MKQNYLRLLVAVLLMQVGISASAYDCEVDGIYYNLKADYAVVTYQYWTTSASPYPGQTTGKTGGKSDYKNDIVIPATITYNGKTYPVTEIGECAFDNCSDVSSISIPTSIVRVATYAFRNCTGVTSIVIPNDAASIENQVFYGCENLLSVRLPNGMKEMNSALFANCKKLESVNVPNSITYVDQNAFMNCNNLNKVIISDIANWCQVKLFNYTANPLYRAGHLYSDEDTEITDLVIPEGVGQIADYAFYGCKSIKSVTIPGTVTSIGNNSFYGAPIESLAIGSSEILAVNRGTGRNAIPPLTNVFGNQLTTIKVSEGVETIGSYAFYQCSSLKDLTLPSTLLSIGNDAFFGCGALETLTLPSRLVTIGESAFQGASSLKSLDIPTSVRTVGRSAFYCNYVSGQSAYYGINLHDSVTSIGTSAFSFNNGYRIQARTITCRVGSSTLLSLWNAEYAPIVSYKGRSISVPAPSLTVKSTQSTITATVSNLLDGYENLCTYRIPKGKDRWNSTIFESYTETLSNNDSLVIKGLWPDYSPLLTLKVTNGEVSYEKLYQNKTSPFRLSVKDSITASSVYLKGVWDEGDAVIDSTCFIRGNDVVGGTTYSLKGLAPSTSFSAQFKVIVCYGDDLQYKEEFVSYCNIKTAALILTTAQPKVISVGNVIVAAESNLDDEEENVGFEWRRTDWTNDFASNTGNAYLYEGKMEGYIRNMNAEKLWKYRPYYLSDAGTYYYGDWVGLDPSNTSYFEPTVHTYNKISVEGNAALVKGYALRGTDGVKVQGFKYWKQASSARGEAAKLTIPSDALTIEASGQVMTANLTGLDFQSTYCYVAFVTTTEGETFYGEQQTFATGFDPTGIAVVQNNGQTATVVARYDVSGRRLSTAQPGLNILRMSDGTSRKVWVK